MPAMPLDALAPDQRAVVQLVLQRGRSYAQIAELLKISDDAVRARAHAGLSSLAPDVELPADKVAQISDFLLGQQNGKPRQATRRLLRENGAAREWAEAVRARLEDVGPLPDLPEGAPAKEEPAAEGRAAEAAPAAADGAPDKPAPRPRPLRDEPRPRPAAEAPAGSSSRVGGAILIGGAVLAIVVVVLVLFVFKGDDNGDTPKNAAATSTATPSATPRQVGQIQLKGVHGSKGTGVMTLFASQGQLAFTLQGANVPPNKKNEAYAVWFRKPGGPAQRLGFAQPVGANGQLGTTGPRTEDLAKFPTWLAQYKQVVVSRETNGNAKTPGPIVLVGSLPSG